MTLCEHDLRFKNNFGDCPTCIRLAENESVLDAVEKIDVLDFKIEKGMPCGECGSRNSSMYIGERKAQAEDEDDGSAYMCLRCNPISFLKQIKRTLKDELDYLRLKGDDEK